MSSLNSEPAQEDGSHATAASLPLLQGCSKEQDRNTTWTLSGATMQAYVAMRGPGIDMDDPLIAWISSEEGGKKAEGQPTMLGDIHDSVKEQVEWNSRGPSKYEDQERQRKTIFTFDRSRTEHLGPGSLELPGSLDVGKLDDICQGSDYTADGWRKYAASDVSDDGEGDPANGRISPCTFARWSHGAKRWDAPDDKFKSAWEERRTYMIPNDRQRPCSPNTALPRQTKRYNTQSLYDMDDGNELSPACSSFARSEPSILWSPPPLDPPLPYTYYNHMFDRMDPELMRKVRMNNASPEPSWGVKSASEPEHYTPSEVDAATEKYWGLALTQEVIANKHMEVAHLIQSEEQANAEVERLRHAAKRFKHENRKLADCFEERRSTRDRRIMKQVQRHIRELSYIAKAKFAECKARVRERDALQRELDSHQDVQRKLLAIFGKETPDEVFAMYPDIWEPEEIRKNRRNYS
ncbi:hypothetical protein J7T55_006303 [Diaporthe amygdali]|uniref:uncharacterized protein n=1 Tax=Phomopsis amygdali TaxID=1214568 RepID=UPI0022FE98EE|nr:uncharacterized protein J7T55_006303 [Diaporthe amygdali]KAJ0124960.1 hypothetical protein J7T55_006303 [Diaporthe amygdali]